MGTLMVREEFQLSKAKTRWVNSSDVITACSTRITKDKDKNWVLCDRGPEDRTIAVKVEVPDGSFIEQHVDPLGRVSDAKEELEEALGIPQARQVLLFGGRVLDRKKSFYDYLIEDENTVQLLEQKDVEFRVHTPDDKTLLLKMHDTDTVLDAVNKVVGMEGITKGNLHLWKQGTMLSGVTMLREYNIGEDSDGKLLELSNGRNPISVTIQSMDGWNMILSLDAEDTTRDLKKRLDGLKKDMPMHLQIVLFNGETLKDEHTLSYYSVKNNDTLNVRLQLTGGGPTMHVVTNRGRYVPMPVFKFDTVHQLKVRVEKLLGVPVEFQELLIHRDHVLRKPIDPDGAHGDEDDIGFFSWCYIM